MPTKAELARQRVFISEDLQEVVRYHPANVLVEKILEIQAKHPGVNLTFDYCEGTSWDSGTFALVGDRLENDEEYDARIAAITEREREHARRLAAQRKRKEDAERAEYERLRKKFEPQC